MAKNNFKDDFLNIWIFFAPSDSRFTNIVQIITNHTSMEILFIPLSDDA